MTTETWVRPARAAILPLLLVLAVVWPRMSAAVFLVTPARDTVRYVEAAEALRTQPLPAALRAMDCHPLYPAALLATKSVLSAMFGLEGPYAWVLAGEVVGIGCYAFFLLTAYALGARLWNRKIAFWGCAMVALLPRQVSYTVDVLTDSLHAWMWMTCLYFLSNLEGPAPWKRFAFAGICAGLAYWTRSEALLLPPIALLGGIVIQCIPQWRITWRSAGLCAAAFGICWAIPVGSYMAAVGKISPRNSAAALTGQATIPEPIITPPTKPATIGDTVIPPPNKAANFASTPTSEDIAATTPPNLTPRAYVNDEAYEVRSLGKAYVAYLYEIGQETRVWMLPFILWGLLAFRRATAWRPAVVYVIFAWCGYSAMLVLLQMKCGYITGRYLMPLMPSLGMLAAIGIGSFLGYASRWLASVDRFGRNWNPKTKLARARFAAIAVVATIALATSMPAWLRSNHRHRQAYLEAAAWINAHTEPGEAVFDPGQLVSFFADRPNWQPRYFPKAIPCRYAVVDVERVYRTDPWSHYIIKRFNEGGQVANKFVQPKSKREGVLYILELPQAVGRNATEGGLR